MRQRDLIVRVFQIAAVLFCFRLEPIRTTLSPNKKGRVKMTLPSLVKQIVQSADYATGKFRIFRRPTQTMPKAPRA